MQGLHENGVKLSPSNGDSADLVARGQFAFSLVDSDDVVNRMKQHEPVTMVYPDQGADEIGSLIVPNAAALIAGSPHQDAGKKLIDYLLSTETERKLAFSDAEPFFRFTLVSPRRPGCGPLYSSTPRQWIMRQSQQNYRRSTHF